MEWHTVFALVDRARVELVSQSRILTRYSPHKKNRAEKVNMLSSVLVGLLLAVPFGLAHPPGVEEKVYQHSAQPLYRRSLSHCESIFQESEHATRTISRRQAEVERLKDERNIKHKYLPRQDPWETEDADVHRQTYHPTATAGAVAQQGPPRQQTVCQEHQSGRTLCRRWRLYDAAARF